MALSGGKALLHVDSKVRRLHLVIPLLLTLGSAEFPSTLDGPCSAAQKARIRPKVERAYKTKAVPGSQAIGAGVYSVAVHGPRHFASGFLQPALEQSPWSRLHKLANVIAFDLMRVAMQTLIVPAFPLMTALDRLLLTLTQTRKAVE